MAGNHRSILTLAAAAGFAIVAFAHATTDVTATVIASTWRRSANLFAELAGYVAGVARWLIAKIPAPVRTWAPFLQLRNLVPAGMKRLNVAGARRPVVFPQWRMCSST